MAVRDNLVILMCLSSDATYVGYATCGCSNHDEMHEKIREIAISRLEQYGSESELLIMEATGLLPRFWHNADCASC